MSTIATSLFGKSKSVPDFHKPASVRVCALHLLIGWLILYAVFQHQMLTVQAQTT
jgi:hypothetical protein